MLIINTTFVVHTSIETEFMDWLSGTLLPAAEASGCFATPTVARVLTAELHRRRGQHLMFFTTPMETVDFPVKTPDAHVG